MRRSFTFLTAILLLVAVSVWLIWQNSSDATVLVEWSTASELDTAGFNLYRSESPQGPFVQINPALIPASSDPLTGRAYSYEDRQVHSGSTYYYQLEEVELDGVTSQYGPISVQAKGMIGMNLYLALGAIVLILVFGLFMFNRRSVGNRLAGSDPTAGGG